MRTSEVIINCGKIFLRSDNIICLELKEDYTVEMDDQCEINSAIGKIAHGSKYFMLTTGGRYTTFSQEVMKNSAAAENFTNTIADAFVINSIHQRLLANFYVKIVKPPVPTKYFENVEDALKWLYSIGAK